MATISRAFRLIVYASIVISLMLLFVPNALAADLPTVISTYPAHGDKDVPEDQVITIKFSKAMNESTLGWNNIIIMNILDGDIFEGDIEYDDATFTLTLSNLSHHERPGLHKGAEMTLTITENVLDFQGNKLDGAGTGHASNYEITFFMEPRENEDEDSSGFGIGLLALGLVGVLVIFSRRR